MVRIVEELEEHHVNVYDKNNSNNVLTLSWVNV